MDPETGSSWVTQRPVRQCFVGCGRQTPERKSQQPFLLQAWFGCVSTPSTLLTGARARERECCCLVSCAPSCPRPYTCTLRSALVGEHFTELDAHPRPQVELAQEHLLVAAQVVRRLVHPLVRYDLPTLDDGCFICGEKRWKESSGLTCPCARHVQDDLKIVAALQQASCTHGTYAAHNGRVLQGCCKLMELTHGRHASASRVHNRSA